MTPTRAIPATRCGNLLFGLLLLLAFVTSAATCARATPPPPGAEVPPQPAIDSPEAEALKLLYEGWLLQWIDPPAPSDYEPPLQLPSRFEAIRARHAKLPTVPSWPVDPARGVLVNDLPKAPEKLVWAEVGVTSDPDSDRHPNLDWVVIAIDSSADPQTLTPVLCVPEACYFRSPVRSPKKGRPVLDRPGFWIALREHRFPFAPGDAPPGLALAGVLIYPTAPTAPTARTTRTAPKAPADPRVDPTFLRWKAELATRFPLPAKAP